MIIAKAKRPERAFCGSSRLEISLVVFPITFLTKELLCPNQFLEQW
jgi:hypothetical protein